MLKQWLFKLKVKRCYNKYIKINGQNLTERKCPICKNTYKDYPAISRVDNKTEICPKCGIEEALQGLERDYNK